MADRWGRERGFGDRAADEVRSWMGDDEAQRRREMDDAREVRRDRDRERVGGRDEYRDRDYRYAGETALGRPDWGWTQGSYEERDRMRAESQGWRNPGSYAARNQAYSRPDSSDYSLGPAYYPPPTREGIRSDYSRRDIGRRDNSGGTYAGMAPRGYRRSDQRILEDVCDRLTDDPYVNPSDIEVKVNDGTVTLSGSVTTREEKRHAEDCVESVSGVRDVSNNLRVSSGVIGSPGAPQTPLNLSSPGGESRQVVNTEAEPTKRR